MLSPFTTALARFRALVRRSKLLLLPANLHHRGPATSPQVSLRSKRLVLPANLHDRGPAMASQRRARSFDSTANYETYMLGLTRTRSMRCTTLRGWEMTMV